MLVDAERRFANRVAKWMLTSKLAKSEIAQRLGLFNDSFVNLVNEEVKRIRNIK